MTRLRRKRQLRPAIVRAAFVLVQLQQQQMQQQRSLVLGWNPMSCHRREHIKYSLNNLDRRQFVLQGMGLCTGLSVVALASPTRATAACLAGDLSPDCIGVYKVPMDERALPYVETPEALAQVAPNLRWVPPIGAPKSTSEALDSLASQRVAANDIQQVVLEGRLEEAGIKILNLIPKVTSAGRYILAEIASQSSSSSSSSTTTVAADELRTTKLEQLLETAIVSWGEADVTLGQGLRGELGVSAVAQIQILNTIQDATIALDDFVTSASASLRQSKPQP